MNASETLPDVRDGLTSVQRVALRAVASAGPTLTRASRVVANAANRKPGHERADLYDAIVTLTNDWYMRYPLVDGEGNFGSKEGDPAAASPFTEVRAGLVASALLSELDDPAPEGITPLDRRAASILLPGPFPQLLANGAQAAGSSLLPHNLGEVAKAVAARIDDPSIGIDALLAIVPGPDLATGGTIIDDGSIRRAYESGHGTLRHRADGAEQETELRLNFTAAVDGEAKTFSLPEIIDAYVDHRREVLERRDALERRAAELAEDGVPGEPVTRAQLDATIKAELLRVAERFGDERRTVIVKG